MNLLSGFLSGLIADDDALDTLAASESSRLLVVSDTHGQYEIFEAIIREFGPGCDALLFAGDGIWDIIQYLENASVSSELQRALPAVFAFVAGNGDASRFRMNLSPGVDDSSVPQVLEVPLHKTICASGHNVLLVHGHRFSVTNSLEILAANARNANASLVIYGHTHVSHAGQLGNVLLVNPGSPARPRGDDEPGFAVIELSSTAPYYHVRFYTIARAKAPRFLPGRIFSV